MPVVLHLPYRAQKIRRQEESVMKYVMTLWFVFLAWGPEDGSHVAGYQAGPFFSTQDCNEYWENLRPTLKLKEQGGRSFTGCVLKWDGFAKEAYENWEAFYTRKHQFGGSR
jgi:hypothetical protein